jgi:hypothetical protein
MPAAIFAASHVTGTAATAGTLTSQRLSITLLIANWKVRFEEFLSDYSHWLDTHSILLSVRTTEAVSQEWLHREIVSDASMENPDSERLLALLHRRRNNLRERQTNRAAQPTEPIMMLKDHPRSLSSGSLDEASTPEAPGRHSKKAKVSDPISPTVHVRAIYGRPQL